MKRREFDALMVLRDELVVELELARGMAPQAFAEKAAALKTIRRMLAAEVEPLRGRSACG